MGGGVEGGGVGVGVSVGKQGEQGREGGGGRREHVCPFEGGAGWEGSRKGLQVLVSDRLVRLPCQLSVAFADVACYVGSCS